MFYLIRSVEKMNFRTVDTLKYVNLHSKVEALESWHNRAFLGATALITMPLIDAFTIKDEEKRKDAISKSLAKVIVGCATGIFLRIAIPYLLKSKPLYHSIALKNSQILISEHSNSFKRQFFPKSLYGEQNKDKFQKLYKEYIHNLGNYAAIFVMFFTNFLVDAPCTVFLTNFFRKHFFGEKKNVYEKPEIQKSFTYVTDKINLKARIPKTSKTSAAVEGSSASLNKGVRT